jgi:SAM-dependent methyltransferase
MRDPDSGLLREVERYYTGRVEEHGASARGVDWSSDDSQKLRFRQLVRLWEGEQQGREISVIDFGCGYGALVDYLAAQGAAFRYQGFDISEAMIREAAPRATAQRVFTTDRDRLERADYVVASGVFNVKLAAERPAWEEYMRRTIDAMAKLATRGFAFNALTSYSDPERQRADLHYADPASWFDHCKRTHSRFVTLLHDYPLYEFTLLVRY